jgi:hypothetical protein
MKGDVAFAGCDMVHQPAFLGFADLAEGVVEHDQIERRDAFGKEGVEIVVDTGNLEETGLLHRSLDDIADDLAVVDRPAGDQQGLDRTGRGRRARRGWGGFLGLA